MKYSSLKILSLCLLLALVVGACMPGFAESDKPALITGSGVLWVGSGRSPVVAVNLPENAKSFSVTSSKPSVLKVGRQKGFGPYGISFVCLCFLRQPLWGPRHQHAKSEFACD